MPTEATRYVNVSDVRGWLIDRMVGYLVVSLFLTILLACDIQFACTPAHSNKCDNDDNNITSGSESTSCLYKVCVWYFCGFSG
jgi:hypothetical protein